MTAALLHAGARGAARRTAPLAGDVRAARAPTVVAGRELPGGKFTMGNEADEARGRRRGPARA